MKIHYLVTSLETGGAEFAIPNIVSALQQCGHSTTVTACEPRDMGAAPRLESAGIPYHLLDTKRRNFPLTLIRLIKLLKAHKPDLIWTSLSRATLLGQLAGKLLGIPVISWKNSASIRFTTTAGRKITRLWVADSSSVQTFLQEKMRIPSRQTISWPLYVSTPTHKRPTPWDGHSSLHIGTTGRLHEVKNYPLLLKGLSLFRKKNPHLAKKIHLSFAGDGPQRKEIEALIQELGLTDCVSLKGFLEDVPSFLKTLHLYAQPSRYEGMCLAAHEAMSIGLPIIATPVGEMRNSVQDHYTGFLLHGDIADTICQTLEEVFSNPSCLAQYGENSRNYIQQHYSHEQFIQNCHNVMQRLDEILGD